MLSVDMPSAPIPSIPSVPVALTLGSVLVVVLRVDVTKGVSVCTFAVLVIMVIVVVVVLEGAVLVLVLVVIVEVGVVVVTVVVAAVVAAVDGAVLVDDVMAIASIFASTSPLPEMRLKIGPPSQNAVQSPDTGSMVVVGGDFARFPHPLSQNEQLGLGGSMSALIVHLPPSHDVL